MSGPIGTLFGLNGSSGNAKVADPNATGADATALFNQLVSMQPQAFQTQATYQPQYTGLTISDILASVMGQNGSGGLADILKGAIPGINLSLNDANTNTAASTVGNVSNLGPQAADAIAKTNPAEAANLAAINDSALSGLKAGSTLAPQDATNISKQVQGNWASRGLGTSAPASLDEALQLFAGGQNVLSQRQQAATSAASLDNSLVTQPALALSTTQSSAPSLTNSILGQGENIAGPSTNTLTDPTSILSAAYNARSAANITSANNSAALNSY